MAIRAATALKQQLEARSYGAPWFVDTPPLYKEDGSIQEQHYGVIKDGQDNVGRRRGNGRDQTLNELGQVDFYQPNATEDYLIFDRLRNDLDGMLLPTAPKQVYGVRVQSAQRTTPGVEDETVRYTYSILYIRDS